MKDLRNKAVLITGAASGIGRETAIAFAKEGAKLILCDVNQAALAELARELGSAVLMTEVVDVANRASMEAFAELVHQKVDAVDVLVNNAGVGLQGGILDTSLEDFEWVIGINLRGVIHGCKLFVPAMVKRGQGGHVVNLSSMAGYVASAGMLGYATSKFAVFGFSESLVGDLAPHGIGVSTICPGVVNTNIIRATRFNSGHAPTKTREKVDEMYRKRNYGPEKVAAAIVAAVRENQRVVPVTPESWLLYYLKRLSPTLARVVINTSEKQAMKTKNERINA